MSLLLILPACTAAFLWLCHRAPTEAQMAAAVTNNDFDLWEEEIHA